MNLIHILREYCSTKSVRCGIGTFDHFLTRRRSIDNSFLQYTSFVSKGTIQTTGPKISSFIQRESSVSPEITVGWMKYPWMTTVILPRFMNITYSIASSFGLNWSSSQFDLSSFFRSDFDVWHHLNSRFPFWIVEKFKPCRSESSNWQRPISLPIRDLQLCTQGELLYRVTWSRYLPSSLLRGNHLGNCRISIYGRIDEKCRDKLRPDWWNMIWKEPLLIIFVLPDHSNSNWNRRDCLVTHLTISGITLGRSADGHTMHPFFPPISRLVFLFSWAARDAIFLPIKVPNRYVSDSSFDR